MSDQIFEIGELVNITGPESKQLGVVLSELLDRVCDPRWSIKTEKSCIYLIYLIEKETFMKINRSWLHKI